MAACGAKTDEAEMKIEVGDYVQVDKDKKGKVVFKGENKYTKEFFGLGEQYGVHLTEKRGTMDGTYKNEKFFACQPGHGVMVPAKRITKILKEADVDQATYKAWAETLAAEAAKEAAIDKAKQAANKLRAIFKKIDTDGNYLIEKNEFVAAMAKESSCAEKDAGDMFVAIDLTKSGSLSMAEFKGFLKKMEDAEESHQKWIELLLK